MTEISITMADGNDCDIPTTNELIITIFPPELKPINVWTVKFIHHGPISGGEMLHNDILKYIQELNKYYANSGEILRNGILEYLKSSWDIFKTYTEWPDLAVLSKINALLFSFLQAQKTLQSIDQSFKIDYAKNNPKTSLSVNATTSKKVNSNTTEIAKPSNSIKSRKSKVTVGNGDFTKESSKIACKPRALAATSTDQTTPETETPDNIPPSNKLSLIAGDDEMDISQKTTSPILSKQK